MGDYSDRDWTWKEMVHMGFLQPKDVPTKYKGISHRTRKPYRFYFRYYDLETDHPTAYLNIGDSSLVREGLKIFSGGEQCKKALIAGGYKMGWKQ